MLLTASRPSRHAAEPSAGADPATARTPGRRTAELSAFALLVLGATWVERHGAGLQGLWSVSPGLLATMPLIVLCRAWRLPLTWLLVAGALPASVIATAVLAPGGWAGAERSAAYAYGSLTFLALAAFARTLVRRLAAALALGLVILDQFAQSWLAWWGSQDPVRMLAGSFDWHNQYGAFNAAGVVLCSMLALVAQPRRLRAVAVLVVSFLATGLLTSASRASVLAAGAGCLVALVLAMRTVGAARAGRRTAGLVAASFAVAMFLRSTLFFPTWSWPWASLVGRSVASAGDPSYQPLSGNASARADFWRAGADLAAQHPLVGTGLSTFGDASRWFLPPGAGRSVDPHNELVRAAAEGGLVGALPVVALLVLALALAVARLRGWWRAPGEASADAAVLAGLLSAGVLVAHALVDFDWSYPTLVMAAGWSLALAAAPGVPQVSPTRARALTGAAAITVAVLAASAGLAVSERSAAGRGASSDPVSAQAQVALRDGWLAFAPDHRLPELAIGLALHHGEPAPAWTLDALRSRARVDAMAALALSQAEFSRGEQGPALQRMRAWAGRDPLRAPELVIGYARLLAREGQGARSADIATRLLVLRSAHLVPIPQTSGTMLQVQRLVAGHPREQACVLALTDASTSPDSARVPPACLPYVHGPVVP